MRGRIGHRPGALAWRIWRVRWAIRALVLLWRVPDWRCGLSGEGTGRYPSLRLLRQAVPGDWTAPVAEVTAALSRAAARRTRSA